MWGGPLRVLVLGARNPERIHSCRSVTIMTSRAEGAIDPLRDENRRLRTLVDFSRRLSAERDLKAQLLMVCAELLQASRSCAVGVMLRRSDRRSFDLVESEGLEPDSAEHWAQLVRAGDSDAAPTGFTASAEFPLLVGDDDVGLVRLFDPRRRQLEDAERTYLASLADAAALALLNARLHAESQRELRRREALREVVASISSELDLDSLFVRVTGSAVELLGAERGMLTLLDEAGNARSRAVYNLPHGIVGSIFRPGEGLTGHVLTQRQPVIVENYVRDVPRPLLDDANGQAGLGVPVWWQGQMVGVFAVLASDTRRVFDGQDREIMELLASHLAIAIENARLYQEVRDRLDQVTALQAAGTALAEELHPERALRVVAEQALSLSGVARVVIELAGADGRGPKVQVIVGEEPSPPSAASGASDKLVLSLRARGRTLGTLSAEPHIDHTFDTRQRELLATFAGQAAISLDNAQLYAELQTRLEEMVGLQRLGTLLLEEHDFDRVLVSICRQLQRLTDAGGVGIALLEDDPRFLEMRTVVGPSADVLRGARIPTEGSFAAEALRTNRPQRSDDAQNDPRGYKQSLTLGNTQTILSVPMKTRQRTVGVLSIYNKGGGNGEGGFTDRDAELATFFANQAAAAIENARLYEQTREYAVIEERNRLARELHDSVTQSLFSVSLLSEAALNLLDRDAPKARERLERANELAQGALAEMRALIFQLRPLTLQEEGLLSALKKHLNALHSRHGRVVELQVTGTARRLPAAVEDAAFRILQESLNNVIKHADATRVQVQLEFESEWLRVCTIDTGRGFDPDTPRQGTTLGMSSMRERAEAVGGRLMVESAPGRGTRVSAELPVNHAE